MKVTAELRGSPPFEVVKFYKREHFICLFLSAEVEGFKGNGIYEIAGLKFLKVWRTGSFQGVDGDTNLSGRGEKIFLNSIGKRR